MQKQFHRLAMMFSFGAALFAVAPQSASAGDHAKKVKVDCDHRQTVGDALEHAGDDDHALVITLNGLCKENVVIDRDDVQIVAGSPGAGIVADDDTVSTIQVLADRVRLTGITVTGGRNGISLDGADHAILEKLAVTRAVRHGVVFNRAANGSVMSSEIWANGRHGIEVHGSAAAVIDGNKIHDQANGSGVDVTSASHARIGIAENGASFIGNTIENNRDGVTATHAASAVLGGNTIRANQRSGASEFAADLDLVGGNQLTDNAFVGVSGSAGAIQIGDSGYGLPTDNTIARNGAQGTGGVSGSGGVTASLGTLIELHGATLTDNVGPNLGLFVRSTARADAATVIAGASGDGVIIGAGGGMWFGGAAQVQSNGGFGVNCVGGPNADWGGASTGVGGNASGSFSPGCHPL